MRGLRIPETLPPLTGWITRLYVALWMAVLAITVVGVLGGAWYQLRQGVGSAYGLDTLGISIGPDRRIDHLGGDEVRVAGVRIGDRVLSVEGIAVPAGGPDSQFNQQLRLGTEQARGPLRLTIQTGHAPPHTLVLTRSMAHGAALYQGTGLTPVSLTRTSALVGLLAPVVLVFGAILLFGRRRDPVAALLSVSLLSLATGTSFSSLFWGDHLNAIWVLNVMAAIGTVGLLLAMQAFPNGRLVPRWTFYLMVATSVLGIVGTFLPSIGSASFFC